MIENKNIGELVLKQGSWLEPNIDDVLIIAELGLLEKSLMIIIYQKKSKKIKVVLYGNNHDTFNILTSKYYN